MKTIASSLKSASLLSFLNIVPLALAQDSESSTSVSTAPPAPQSSLSWQAVSQDGLSTTWQASELVTDALTGEVTNRIHQYVEIASGLNYLADPATGEWAASQDLIELMPDGSAAALRGPAKLYAKPNLNSVGAITIVTVSNRVFQTRPIGLYWYDPISNKASLIAQIQDCVGELEPPNQLVYKAAFGQIADLRLTYTKGALESDLVLLQRPQLPAGFDPATARLELWHEWLPLQAPKATTHLAEAPDLTDEILDFGDLWLPAGAAYWTDGSVTRDTNTAAAVRVPNLAQDASLVPVAKQWLQMPSRDVLVEAVRWRSAANAMVSLPGAISVGPPAKMQDRFSWLADLAAPTAPASASGTAISQGSGYHPIGLVWDYIAVPGTCTTNYTFASGQTYYVSSYTYFSANVAFNPGCCIKFNGNYLLIYGSITCNGTTANPSILTAWNDDLFGGWIQTESTCPTYSATEALWSYYINSNVSLGGMRIRWASTAIEFDANGCGYSNSVTGCSLELCQVGIYANAAHVAIFSSAYCGVPTPTRTGNGCSYFTGTLTDICTGDSDLNGAPDLTEYQYFGRLGSLPGNVLGGVISRTNYSQNLTQVIWSSRDDVNMLYTYNTGCWLYGVTGLSAFSPWHQTFGTEYSQQAGPTLITRRHAITINHMAFPANTPVRFVGTDNVAHQVTCLYGQSLPDVDCWVMVFDQDLPTNVGYVRVLPSNVLHKLTPTMQQWQGPCYYSANIPLATFNAWKDGYVNDCYHFFTSSGVGPYAATQVSQWCPTYGSYCYRAGNSCSCQYADLDVNGGDSGSPSFLVINGELALIGPQYGCGVIPWPGYYMNELNATITSLDTWVSNQYGTNAMTGYTATAYPLDSFPDLW